MDELKQRQRAMWATGDFPTVAEKIAEVGSATVEAADVGPDMDVLDVAAGAGNAAIPAAVRGARVVASDLTPEMFETGRRKAAEAGVELEWVEADAEDLPFEDGRFDRVLTTFGAMFAPRHQRTADELVRVCRPGGAVVMANWTPPGAVGQMFKLMSSHMPPPPDYASPPPMWGTEDHVRELFAPHDLDLSFEHRFQRLRDDSADSYITFMETYFGPMIAAKGLLSQSDEWDGVRAGLVSLYDDFVVEDDSSPWAADAEYLLVVGRKPEA